MSEIKVFPTNSVTLDAVQTDNLSERKEGTVPTELTDEEMKRLTYAMDHLDLIILTGYLADNGYSAQDVAYAVEKPWKFMSELALASAEIEALPDV